VYQYGWDFEYFQTSIGYTGEGKVSFVIDQKKTSQFGGLDFIHDQEFGEYLQFRKDIATPTSNTVNAVYRIF